MEYYGFNWNFFEKQVINTQHDCIKSNATLYSMMLNIPLILIDTLVNLGLYTPFHYAAECVEFCNDAYSEVLQKYPILSEPVAGYRKCPRLLVSFISLVHKNKTCTITSNTSLNIRNNLHNYDIIPIIFLKEYNHSEYYYYVVLVNYTGFIYLSELYPIKLEFDSGGFKTKQSIQLMINALENSPKSLDDYVLSISLLKKI